MPPSHSHHVFIDPLTPEQVLAAAADAATQLGWTVTDYSGDQVRALTQAALFGAGEIISVQIEHGMAVVTSSSQLEQHDYWDTNRQNLAVLLRQMKQTIRQQPELQEALQPPPPPPPPAPPPSYREWYHVFVPSKGVVMTPLIIDLNILLFFLMVVTGADVLEPSVDYLVRWGANYGPLTMGGQIWRLVTSTFLHIGFLHLGMNMGALFFIGLLLEPLLGKARFLAAYFATGIFASLTSAWWHGPHISAGASGAIFGMYGAFIALLTTRAVAAAHRQRLLVSMALFVGYNLVGGLKPGIDNAAHIGGLLSGAAIGYLYYPGLARPFPPFKWGAVGLVLFAAVITAMMAMML